jgi:hypothetical protein
MTASPQQIESFARDRMRTGDLLTWQFDEAIDEVTFFIPPEADETRYPEDIHGTPVVLRKIPRPLAYTGQMEPK